MVGFPLFSTVLGFSRISRTSKFSRISRKWTFLKRPLFQKTPFSEPEKICKIVQFLAFIRKSLVSWVDSRTLYCRTPEKWFGAEIQQNDSDHRPKIRVTGRKSELQAENRRYRPAENRHQIRTESPGKVPERVFGLSTEKGLKASLNPVNSCP